mmetsp:Transcript_35593/g.90312  ORF Transcript_35593/g.90312 Transcript_35593/m.90312 type:complete len:262 (+) Transcript_35593:1392-2177(+)
MRSGQLLRAAGPAGVHPVQPQLVQRRRGRLSVQGLPDPHPSARPGLERAVPVLLLARVHSQRVELRPVSKRRRVPWSRRSSPLARGVVPFRGAVPGVLRRARLPGRGRGVPRLGRDRRPRRGHVSGGEAPHDERADLRARGRRARRRRRVLLVRGLRQGDAQGRARRAPRHRCALQERQLRRSSLCSGGGLCGAVGRARGRRRRGRCSPVRGGRARAAARIVRPARPHVVHAGLAGGLCRRRLAVVPRALVRRHAGPTAAV